MNTLHKGALTVVVATVVASGMILLSESSIADNKKSATLAPPPGPFLNEELPASTLQKKPPIAPTQATFLKVKPKVELKPPVAPLPSSLKPSFGNVKQHEAPKLAHKIHAAPSRVQAPNLSKSMPPSPQYKTRIQAMGPPNVPIWSQKGQGTNLGSSHSKAPLNNNGAVMSNNNFGWGYPVQQYMYIPVPLMPSNIVVPQVPAFNRVPAPMPNYWIPTPEANKSSIQKNLPKKDNN